MAVVVADKDHDVPVAYIETYQNDLFSKTDNKLEAFSVAIVVLPSPLSHNTKLHGRSIPTPRSISKDSNAEGG